MKLPLSFPTPRVARSCLLATISVAVAFAAHPSLAQSKAGGALSNVQLLDKALDKAPDSPRVVMDDMILPRAQLLAYRNRVAQTGGRQLSSAFYNIARWTGGNVFYVFDAGLPQAQRTAFLDACREWEKWVNVKFAPRTSEANFIHVYQDPSDGSFSYVGMNGGSQDMSLASWGTKWTACHEIGHALGVMHEQSRSDRDTYVTINFANVKTGMEGNFAIVSTSLNQGTYDFDSVMHYPSTGFAIDPTLFTITANSAYAQYQGAMGQRDHLSTLDKAGMVAIYGAPPTGPRNDLFAQATIISGASGTVTGSNAGSTKEADEPNHAGDDGTATVWYKWTAPSTGTASFSTAGSAFDTTLAVYTGTSVSSLANVASNGNVSSSDLTSALSFSSVAGTTYSIAVNGSKRGTDLTATGAFTLKWSTAAAYSLGGTVSTNSGSKLSGVVLSLSGGRAATTTSATNGTYSFAALAAGSYTVTPSKSGYTFSPTSRQYTLSGHVTGAAFTATATGTKPTITASISSVSSVEGNAGTPYITFNVVLSEASTQTVTLNYTTVNGTAVAGSDYTAKSGTITFPAGTTMADIRINVLPDRVQEANETFSVVLSNPVGATLNVSTGKGTLVNDDVANDVEAPRPQDSDPSNPSSATG